MVSSSRESDSGTSGTTTTSQPQSAARSTFVELTDKHQFGAGAHGSSTLVDIHAVDRNA